ncbi:MAG: AMP-binding protein [Clostridia bacterium]|nr:AMP-binding protein [Clostridia bacterium]
MNILRDRKMPEFKFPKFKFDNLSELAQINVEEFKDKKNASKPKKSGPYIPTEYKTIKEIFEKNTIKYKDRPFILEKFNKKEYESISFGDYREDVIGFGTSINKILGLQNKKVAIIGENTYHWYVSYMTLLCSNQVSVNLDKDIPTNEIENLLNRSGASAIIYSGKKKNIIEKIKSNVSTVEYFIEMNSEKCIDGKDVGMQYLIDLGKKMVAAGDNDFMKIEIDPEEFKVLIFTSGTTSRSKGVMICNRNLAQNINAVSSFVKLYPEDRFFSVLPLHHTYESTIGYLLPLANGSSIAVCEGLRYLVDNLRETKPTAMLAVPLLIEKVYAKITDNIKKSKKESIVNSMIYMTNMLKYVNIDIKKKVFKEIHQSLGGNLRIIVSAAAPIDEKVIRWFEDIGIVMLQGYGLTETAPIAALTPEYDRKAGTVGKPVNCAEIKVDHPNEKGEGELLIKSDTLMLGYYQDKEKTDEVIVDGWFKSGDVGYIDKDGDIHITGRSKNVIVTKNGKNIYPEEIELLLNELKEVKECIICGRESTKNDDLIITAVIVPEYEYFEHEYSIKSEEEEKIYDILNKKIKEVNRRLSSYKVIKKIEIKKEEFEKTTTMKIKR